MVLMLDTNVETYIILLEKVLQKTMLLEKVLQKYTF